MNAEILIVDDDRAMRESLRALLKGEGYRVRTACDGGEALAAVAERVPDLVVLDVMMPRKNGFAASAELHRVHPDLPVILLTAFDTDANEIRAFGCGADDCISKDVSDGVLLARIGRALRRTRESDRTRNALTIGTVEIDLDYGTLTRGNKVTRLTRSECDILRVLANANGVPMTKSDVIAALRGQGFACTDYMLYSHVYRLRRKLGDAESALMSSYKTGYCLLKS